MYLSSSLVATSVSGEISFSLLDRKEEKEEKKEGALIIMSSSSMSCHALTSIRHVNQTLSFFFFFQRERRKEILREKKEEEKKMEEKKVISVLSFSVKKFAPSFSLLIFREK